MIPAPMRHHRASNQKLSQKHDSEFWEASSLRGQSSSKTLGHLGHQWLVAVGSIFRSENPTQRMFGTWKCEGEGGLKLVKNKVEHLSCGCDISQSHTQQTQTSGMRINCVLQERDESIMLAFPPMNPHQREQGGASQCQGLERLHLWLGTVFYRNKVVVGVDFHELGRESEGLATFLGAWKFCEKF